MTTTPHEIVVQADAVRGGHVNNVKYLEFLERARQPWYEFFGQVGIRSFMAHLSASYKKEAFLGDILQVHTALIRVGNTSFVLQHTIVNQNEELVLEAEATLVSIDAKTGEKIRVPDEIRRLAR